MSTSLWCLRIRSCLSILSLHHSQHRRLRRASYYSTLILLGRIFWSYRLSTLHLDGISMKNLFSPFCYDFAYFSLSRLFYPCSDLSRNDEFRLSVYSSAEFVRLSTDSRTHVPRINQSNIIHRYLAYCHHT